MRQIVYGCISLLGDPEVVKYDPATKAWTFDKAGVEAEFKAVANSGAGGIRLLALAPRGWWKPAEPLNPALQFQPYILNPTKTKFDLSRFNGWYFPLVREIISLAKKYGMKTMFCWLDNCELAGAYKKWSPWVTNTQGITTCYDPKAVPFIKTWIQKCYDEFSGLDVRWAWGNEMNKPGMKAVAVNAIFPMLTKLALDPKKMAYGATMKDAPYVGPGEYSGNAGMLDTLKLITGEAFGDKVKLSIWKEVHGCGGKGYPAKPNRLDQAMAWWLRPKDNGIRVWLSDDGTKDGDSTCDTAFDGARPSAERWAEMVKMTAKFGNDITYEHLPQDESSEGLACQVKTLTAIFKAVHGHDPEELYHYEPPETPQPPEPPVPPEPPAPKSCYEKYIKGRPMRLWQVGRFLACLLGGRK